MIERDFKMSETIESLKKKNNELEYEISKYKSYMIKWQDQLKIDGVNSKGMVLNDIQFLLKEKK